MKQGFAAICHGLGEGGAGRSCRAVPRGDGLEVLVDGDHAVALPYGGMSVSFSGVDDRYLCFAATVGGRALTLLVPDREITSQIEALGAPRGVLDQLRQVSAARGRRRAGRWGVLGGIGAVLLLLAVLAWLGFGWATGKLVEAIPVQWEVELGRATAGQILSEQQVCADPELNLALSEIGARLVAALGQSPYAFKLRVLDSSDVNAFALPGGYVFVNRGLIETADDGAEVAGVLAHELQHVLERHGLRNLAHQAGLMLIVAALFGDAGQLQQFLMYNAASLASMSFSREQERRADTGGLSLMHAAGLDASGLPRFLAKLAAEEGSLGEVMTMISTHPGSAERVQELERIIAAWPPAPRAPLSRDLAALADRCDPVAVSNPDAP